MYAIAVVGVFMIIIIVRNYMRNKSRRVEMMKRAQQKRSNRDSIIQNMRIPEMDLPITKQEAILNSDVTNLLKLLETKFVTSAQILVTYYKRAVTLGLELELIAETNFDEALKQAQECDNIRKNNPQAMKGVLFGIPISIKENIEQKGFDCSGGFASRCFQPFSKDCLLIDLLKNQGAIPFIRSNVPQCLFSCESVNHIWGRARNPWNRERTCGGSSGGEAGLVAAKCSPLGIGNDQGGSIRIPSFYCGVYGFKPTDGRITMKGMMHVAPSLTGHFAIKPVHGPIGKSVNDLNLVMKCLVDEKFLASKGLIEGDPYLVTKEWREKLVNDNSQLRIGVVRENHWFGISEPNRRAVDEAVEALKKKNHTIVELSLPVMRDIFLHFCQFLAAEGNFKFAYENLQGEELIEELQTTARLAQLPRWLRMPLAKILKCVKQQRAGELLENAKKLDAYELLHNNAKMIELRDKLYATWNEFNLDGIIMAGTSSPALKHGYGKDLFVTLAESVFSNVMNLPSGAVPVTVVKSSEDHYTRERSGIHWDVFSQKMAENMQGSRDLPIGVQVCTLPFEDEKCLSIMRQIAEEIPFSKTYSPPI
jgi:fatty acid amide hydrolase